LGNGQANEGRAYVYRGSIAGLVTTAAWTAESDQAGASFGASVSTAGDVNGDGYADVVIGAHLFDNGQADEGRTYVYHGSGSGLATTPAWTAENVQAGAELGNAVATAGDVNGDGYADVIVGVERYSNGQSGEGRAYVYQGSAFGLAVYPAWFAESDSSSALFGSSVASAGDVNGDGYADVIVGARQQGTGGFIGGGRAFVYHGSPSGLATVAGWTPATAQGLSFFGESVATAGDVNGDGYADVIVGAPRHDNALTDEGRAFVYYGNGGAGSSLVPRQRSSTATRPIAHLGVSDSPDSFRLSLLGRTPFGRGKVKLEWEVKPLGSPMNGIETKIAVHASDTGPAGATVSEQETGLIDLVPYHWRVRLRYHQATTPFAQHSRWLTVPWGGWNETMLRAGDPSPAGSVPDGVQGNPVTITKGPGVTIAISWDPSCLPNDGDYVIYEGTLGDFTSHEPRYCTTSGATTKTFTPLAGDTYYLIVPTNGTREGSLGRRSDGTERPPGVSACLPQQVGVCE